MLRVPLRSLALSCNVSPEQRTITQVCEMFLREGIEDYKKEGTKFIQRLVAKQKARVKEP